MPSPPVAASATEPEQRYDAAMRLVHQLRDQRFHAAVELSELLRRAVTIGPGNSICYIDTARASVVMEQLVELDRLLNDAIIDANRCAHETGKQPVHIAER